MKKYSFLFLLFSFLQADILFTETFDNSGTWPTDWSFDQYINPETGEVHTSFGQHNWRIDYSYQSDPGFTPPAAVFHYSPRIPLPSDVFIGDTHPAESGNDPQSELETSYELSMHLSLIHI